MSATGDWPPNEIQQLGYLLLVVDIFTIHISNLLGLPADSHFGELRVTEHVNVLCAHLRGLRGRTPTVHHRASETPTARQRGLGETAEDTTPHPKTEKDIARVISSG